MDDFLHDLRNGNAKRQRIPITRKIQDNIFIPKNQRFHHNYGNNRNIAQRPPRRNQNRNQLPICEDSFSLLQEALERIFSLIEVLTWNQEYSIDAQEKTADMMERKVVAIEKILDHLNIYPKTSEAHEIVENNSMITTKEDTIIADPVENLTPVKSIVRKKNQMVKKDFKINDSSNIKLLKRGAIMDIIKGMRKEGATFNQIAQKLIDLGQPTFSGRGEWHAQTIHRLCNK